MNIVLIGYRGTGKSRVGEILARRLNMRCVGMDPMIVEKAGMSIPKIVEKYGWTKFRDMESELALELSREDNIIIDTGGGVIERSENMASLKNNANIFWLKASVDTIVSRISDDTNRPALTSGKTFTEEIAEVLEKRLPKYKGAAEFEVDTDKLAPEEVADIIVDILHHQRR